MAGSGAAEKAMRVSTTATLDLATTEAVHDLRAALRERDDAERGCRVAPTPARVDDARRELARASRRVSLMREALDSMLQEAV